MEEELSPHSGSVLLERDLGSRPVFRGSRGLDEFGRGESVVGAADGFEQAVFVVGIDGDLFAASRRGDVELFA